MKRFLLIMFYISIIYYGFGFGFNIGESKFYIKINGIRKIFLDIKK